MAQRVDSLSEEIAKEMISKCNHNDVIRILQQNIDIHDRIQSNVRHTHYSKDPMERHTQNSMALNDDDDKNKNTNTMNNASNSLEGSVTDSERVENTKQSVRKSIKWETLFPKPDHVSYGMSSNSNDIPSVTPPKTTLHRISICTPYSSQSNDENIDVASKSDHVPLPDVVPMSYVPHDSRNDEEKDEMNASCNKHEFNSIKKRYKPYPTVSSVKVRERLHTIEVSQESIHKSITQLKSNDSLALKNYRELKLKYEDLRSFCNDILRGVDDVREGLREAITLWRMDIPLLEPQIQRSRVQSPGTKR